MPRATLRRDASCRFLPGPKARRCDPASPAMNRSARRPPHWEARRENPPFPMQGGDRVREQAGGSWLAVGVAWRDDLARRGAEIELAAAVLRNAEAGENAERGGDRQCEQRADETEQGRKGENGEHDPDGMQADAVADQLRRKEIPLDELADGEDADHQTDLEIARPEREERQGNPDNEAEDRAEIGNETDDARNDADDEAELQADQRQAHGVNEAENEADNDLPAHEAFENRVDVARELTDRLLMIARQQRIDALHHAVPVEQHVEGDDRRHHDERDETDDLQPLGTERRDDVHQPVERAGEIFRNRPLNIRPLHAQQTADTSVADLKQKFLPALQHRGRQFDECDELVVEDRNQHDQQDDRNDDEGDRDDARRRAARETVFLQPVGQRIEKIGDRHTGNERQENALEQPEHDDEHGDDGRPDGDLPLHAHARGSLSIGYCRTLRRQRGAERTAAAPMGATSSSTGVA